jgi:uncharacterized protein (DUF952 family)
MRVFHIALASDWAAAERNGSYTTSTRGRTLAEEGFIHCSQDFQVDTVREAFYADVVEPLLLLTVDTDLLDVPWRMDEVPGSADPFPHVYGAIPVAAVVAAEPLSSRQPG